MGHDGDRDEKNGTSRADPDVLPQAIAKDLQEYAAVDRRGEDAQEGTQAADRKIV